MAMPTMTAPRPCCRARPPAPLNHPSAEPVTLFASPVAFPKNNAAWKSAHEALPEVLEMQVFVPIDCALSILFGNFRHKSLSGCKKCRWNEFAINRNWPGNKLPKFEGRFSKQRRKNTEKRHVTRAVYTCKYRETVTHTTRKKKCTLINKMRHHDSHPLYNSFVIYF